MFHPLLPTTDHTIHTQTEISFPVSQIDPIVEFSSPARSIFAGQSQRIRTGAPVPDLASEKNKTPDHRKDLQTVAESYQPKVVKTVVDGEEVYVAWTQSIEDTIHLSNAEQAAVIADGDLDTENPWEDEDLAMLSAGNDVRLHSRVCICVTQGLGTVCGGDQNR